MASNLRVDNILPSNGTNIGIGTANGSVTFLGDTDISTTGDVIIAGNLGVGGTITYEDVARVDATGISTFREGFGVGPLTGIALTAYADGSIRTSGIITASTFGSDTNSIFTTGGSERLRITSVGQVLVGLATARNTQMVVYGDGTDDNKPAILFQNTITGTADNSTGIYIGGNHNDAHGYVWNYEAQALIFGTNNTERLRIDNTGRLLIGTTTEGSGGADELTINTPSGHGGMTIRTANDSNGNIWFSDGTSGAAEYAGWLQYAHASNNLNIGVNSVEKIRIHTDGTTSFASGIGLGNALTYAASNTLDDYEHGSLSLTMTASGGGSISTGYNQGYYVKIGNVVHVVGDLRFTGSWSGSGGDLYMNLPFTSNTNGGCVGGGTCPEWNTNSNSVGGVFVKVDNNESIARFTFHNNDGNNNTNPFTSGYLNNNRYLKFSYTYYTHL